MAYTNSPLVSYTKISPNRTPNRDHNIDTVTVHCVVGQLTAESIAWCFADESIQASCNYGVGKDGDISLVVEEKDRSWCSSSGENDHRAITIEVASDMQEPYRVTDAAYESLIRLLADICQRNGIERLVWSENKNDRVNHLNGCNMTVHRDFANKSCPGEYLYAKHGEIAERVNEILEEVNMMRYNKVEEMPSYAQESIQALIDAGALRGDENGNLNLSEDMMRMLVINKRYVDGIGDTQHGEALAEPTTRTELAAMLNRFAAVINQD